MAGVFEKLQNGFNGTLGKAQTFTTESNNKISIGEAKTQRKNLLQEKNDLLSSLGWQTYKLHQEGKLETHEELEYDLSQLSEIDCKLDELKEIIEKQEKMKRPKNICECGTKLSKNDQFCPNCGKRAKDVIICKCGKELAPDTKFCNFCGTDVSTLPQNGNEEEKTCICGATIMAGQIMCMECGRSAE